MRLAIAVLTVCLAPMLADDGVEREVLYIGAIAAGDTRVPRFDKGYIVFLNDPNEIVVYAPTGKLAFTQRLTAPGSRQCSPLSAAVDTDGAVAVSIGYLGSAGYAGGILLLDSRGNPTSFVDTKRYTPSHICFDREHSIWSIGWQRDETRNESEDVQEHFIVRKFSKSGNELGAFLARSLWKQRGQPGAASLGYWTISAANDRVGALVYGNHDDNSPEWVEWDLSGNLLSRVRVPSYMNSGRAYTGSGRLYARLPDATGKSLELRVLDRTTGTWKAVKDPCAGEGILGCGLLMGADGEHLVYRQRGGGPIRLRWVLADAADPSRGH